MNLSLLQPLGDLSALEISLDSLAFLFFAIILAEIVVDFCFQKKRNYRETAANLVVGAIHDFFSARLGNIVAFIGLSFVAQLSPFQVPVTVGTTLFTIFLVDFLYYWNHRIEHRVRFFWAYHSTHHSCTDFDLTVALRISWVEDFIIWIFYIPLALLGFDPLQILLAFGVVGVYQIWIHTQKIGNLGILEFIFNTASNHRVHHAANPDYIDKNYGGILIIWDILFGTYQAEVEKPKYGLTKNINTQNPMKINFIEYGRIFSDWRRSRNFREFWLSWFGAP